jgi:phasin family protein
MLQRNNCCVAATRHQGVAPVLSQMQEFVVGKAQMLNGQLARIRHESVRSARAAAQDSADSLKSLKTPVRVIARSGVRVSTVSQTAVQELIELQSEMLTAAIAEFALRLERASRAGSVVEFVRGQVEMLPATRARMADEAGRAVRIVATAGRELRGVARQTYARVTDAASEPATPRRTRRTARKTRRHARKAAA